MINKKIYDDEDDETFERLDEVLLPVDELSELNKCVVLPWSNLE
jgi:hypothetical protein